MSLSVLNNTSGVEAYSCRSTTKALKRPSDTIIVLQSVVFRQETRAYTQPITATLAPQPPSTAPVDGAGGGRSGAAAMMFASAKEGKDAADAAAKIRKPGREAWGALDDEVWTGGP